MYHILQTMNDFLLFYLVYYLDGYFSIAFFFLISKGMPYTAAKL